MLEVGTYEHQVRIVQLCLPDGIIYHQWALQQVCLGGWMFSPHTAQEINLWVVHVGLRFSVHHLNQHSIRQIILNKESTGLAIDSVFRPIIGLEEDPMSTKIIFIEL